ncbi:MAG: zinc ribbon domain-containing protein [Bacteroidetes bacterium]|nr:zinc ribbon domain-containing protein [Bacteroidota bacterium]
MKLCPNCAAEIIPGSKFCHRCGDKVAERMKDCPSCHEQSPLASVFCHHCGFHFEGRHRSDHGYQPVYALDFNPDTLTDQVKALFFKSLKRRIEEEHDVNKYSDYVHRFYDSRFREIYSLRAEQIAEDVMMQWERFGTQGLEEVDRRIETAFEGLMDYFIIQFCPDLNGVLLPPAILKYEKIQLGQVDLWAVLSDFLDFEREEEVFYIDFISMPSELLANACKNYLCAERKEKVYFICDLSLKGNCKEGFAMTDKAIYWKAPFDKARKVTYEELREIRREKEWITINGHFFTANPSLNLKLCKLLKKMRVWKPEGAPKVRVHSR